MQSYGWIGVDLFFSISAFLFFHLLSAEMLKQGSISISNFCRRRALRIAPLLWTFVIIMVVFFSAYNMPSLVRGLGSMLGMDNVLAWISGYNTSVPYTAHLWTISFEAQIYLFIPFAFLAYENYGKRAFIKSLIFLCAFSFVALSGAGHPVVWVSPFLRPEAVLLGIALAINPPSWNPILSVVGTICALAFIKVLPSVDTMYGSIFVYPFTAIAASLIVDAALRIDFLAKCLSWTPIRFVGKISFGMYVFHLLTLGWTQSLLSHLGVLELPAKTTLSSIFWVCTSLAFCLALSIVSYYLLELPFLRMKARRYSAVEGRA